MSKLSTMERVQYYGVLAVGAFMAVLICVAIYSAMIGYSLVGKKVVIDGKELTITASQSGEVILSDRTRINVDYARTILKEK